MIDTSTILKIRSLTDQGELFEPSTAIKQKFLNPTKKIDDTQDNKSVFNNYGTKDFESIQRINFPFEINKQSPEIAIAKTQKYKIWLNIDQHYGRTTTKQEQPQSSSNTDAVTYKNEIKPKIDFMIKEFNDIWNQEMKSVFNKESEPPATVDQNILQEQMELVLTKYRELSKENITFNASDKINDPVLKEKNE